MLDFKHIVNSIVSFTCMIFFFVIEGSNLYPTFIPLQKLNEKEANTKKIIIIISGQIREEEGKANINVDQTKKIKLSSSTRFHLKNPQMKLTTISIK